MHKKFLLITVSIIIFLILLVIITNKCNETKQQEQSYLTYSVNNLWDYSFQSAWYELENYLNTDKILFLDGDETENQKLLNNHLFGKNLLSEECYYVKVARTSKNIKNIIQNELYEKFKIQQNLDGYNFENNGIVIYSYLSKNINFKDDFEKIQNRNFYVDEDKVCKINGFGIDKEKSNSIINNIDSAYYKSPVEYGIELNTTRVDEIIILIPSNINLSFETIWQEYNQNLHDYEVKFNEEDKLFIPNTVIDAKIKYEDLCGRELISKNGEYISTAILNVNFSLNNHGAIIKNESIIETDVLSSLPTYVKDFNFNRPYVIFVKEKNREAPYFALKIYDNSFLEEVEST